MMDLNKINGLIEKIEGMSPAEGEDKEAFERKKRDKIENLRALRIAVSTGDVRNAQRLINVLKQRG